MDSNKNLHIIISLTSKPVQMFCKVCSSFEKENALQNREKRKEEENIKYQWSIFKSDISFFE